MLVYSNEFYLEPQKDGLRNLKAAIKRWLGKKIGPAFAPTKIIPFAQPFTCRDPQTGINEVMIIGTPDNAPDYCLSINYRHNDVSVHGRAWFVRIGIERATPEAPTRVTILLETSDVSPQVAAIPVMPSQPGIVQAILKACPLDPRTPGAEVRSLTAARAEKFKGIVEATDRYHAIIVVSPDDFSEEPCVDVTSLQDRLVGLAQVYEIRNKRDAWKLRKELPPWHTAWDGSITVISPGRSGPALGRVYRQDEIAALCHDASLTFDRYLFNELTHRYNLPMSRRHIGDDVVGRRLVAFKLARLREQASGTTGLEDLVESYEKDRNEAQRHAADLEFKLLEADERIEKVAAEKQALEQQLRALQFTIRQMESRTSKALVSDDLSPGPATPESLAEFPATIGDAFGDKLIVTNHASKTLRDSPFENVERAWKAFVCLAESFHPAFSGEARLQDAIGHLKDCDGKYTANQSEITAGMKNGYERTHNGTKYRLNKHIGLGSARDPRHCFRLYFEWEPAEKKIIILHAGEHLDTQST